MTEKTASPFRKRFLVASIGCGILLGSWLIWQHTQIRGPELGIPKRVYTADLMGKPYYPCRLVVYSPQSSESRGPEPERLVLHSSPGSRDAPILWECYRDDIFLPSTSLLQYYRVTGVDSADVDDDGFDEAVVYWDSDCQGSGWIQTLEILDYDPGSGEFRNYRGATAAGPFGGFVLSSLDPAGSVQRVFGYSFRTDGMGSYTGEECRWCPHRYRLAVYTIAESGLVVDLRWNGGQVAFTQLRFPCDGSGKPTDEFRSLPDYYLRSSLYNTLDTGPPFVVLSPQPNQIIGMPFSLRVEIPHDMPELGLRIASMSSIGDETVLLKDVIQGWAYDPSTSWKVEDTPYYAAPTGSTGEIVLYDPTDPDNAERQLRIPIQFAQIETKTAEVFFANDSLESEGLVFPVERTIPVEESVLDQLTRGPTGLEEEEMGYATYLLPTCKAQNYHYVEYPCSGKLWDVDIESGEARFSAHDYPTYTAIEKHDKAGVIAREQIRQTLLQLPDVASVTFWTREGKPIDESETTRY